MKVGQIRAENVSAYICEIYFFLFILEIKIKFQRIISLIRYVIDC